MERSGLMVPVLVTGTFAAPTFRPDLEGILKDQLKKGIPDASEIKKTLEGKGTQKAPAKSVDEAVKGLKKLLPFGN
jgi:AsmA protein